MQLSFDRAFIDRPPTHRLSDGDIERIARAYRRAKTDPRGEDPRYRVGNEWAPIYSRYMGEFIDALSEGPVERLRHELENFFRRPFSNGLHGLHFEMTERYMTPGRSISPEDAAAYVHTVKADLDRLLVSVPHLDLRAIEVPVAGNPYGFELDGRFAYGLHFLYFAQKIDQLLQLERPCVVELGGGYGGLAWAIRTWTPQACVFNFDLPEVLAIASFYALSVQPDARIALFGEADVSQVQPRAESRPFDLIFMPNFEIERLPDNAADLSFNSWSLAEMEPMPIANYVGHLCRIARRYVFHVNHTVHCKIGSDLFPIDYEKFRLLHRAPAMWGKSEYRNRMVDEHEFIYRAKH